MLTRDANLEQLIRFEEFSREFYNFGDSEQITSNSANRREKGTALPIILTLANLLYPYK